MGSVWKVWCDSCDFETYIHYRWGRESMYKSDGAGTFFCVTCMKNIPVVVDSGPYYYPQCEDASDTEKLEFQYFCRECLGTDILGITRNDGPCPSCGTGRLVNNKDDPDNPTF